MTENVNKIDITSTAVEKGFNSAANFLSKLIKPAVEETGLLLADQVRYFRYKNQIELLQKAEAYVKKKSISVKEIPVKTIASLLEGASLEEDENLKQMWVGLLVNYVDSEKNFHSSVYPYILGQLSTREALFLKYLLCKLSEFTAKFSEEDISELIENARKITSPEIGNLLRLGLIEYPPELSFAYTISEADSIFKGTAGPGKERGISHLRLTFFGN